MKLIQFLIFIIAIGFTCLSCHKSSGPTSAVSVNIVHAMATGNPIIPNFGDGPVQYYATAQQVSYGNAQLYSSFIGSVSLAIVGSMDTTHAIFDGNLNLGAGRIYSFFLSGDTSKPDTLFTQDEIPASSYSDSSAWVRIVNLSPDSQPISVNIEGNDPAQAEFTDLAYRKISAFKKYAANSSVLDDHYILEFRYQGNDSLLISYPWYYNRFKSTTLVISGSAASTSSTPLNIFSVNNF